VVAGGWQVYVVNEVRDWIDTLDCLDTAAHTRVVQARHPDRRRTRPGSTLGRHDPRIIDRQPQGTAARNGADLFAFDPWRDSILLVAGDKAGHWTQWYREAIPLAEQRYERYLKERTQEERSDDQPRRMEQHPRRTRRPRRRGKPPSRPASGNCSPKSSDTGSPRSAAPGA
jgi:hypothetical protein